MDQVSARKGFNLKGIGAAVPGWAAMSSGIIQNSFFRHRSKQVLPVR